MYGDFTVMVDDCVGQILARLDELELANNTLVIFTSDNGPVWYPEDVNTFEHRSAHMLRGRRLGPYEGGHRVPFIVRWPGLVQAGKTSSDMIFHTDV